MARVLLLAAVVDSAPFCPAFFASCSLTFDNVGTLTYLVVKFESIFTSTSGDGSDFGSTSPHALTITQNADLNGATAYVMAYGSGGVVTNAAPMGGSASAGI